MSAWRGEARNTSAPNRDASTRGEPTTEIISIAQQARPNVRGKRAFARPQLSAPSSVVVRSRSSTPDEHQGDEQQRDEDEDLREDEDALGRMHEDADRVEEDDLDVEEDEEHRDHVEAHPEPERAGDVGGKPALVGLGLDRVRTPRPDHPVQQCERASHDDP